MFVKIKRIINLTERVRLYYFSGLNDKLPAFDPGSHIGIFLQSGLERSYSLLNTYRPDGDYVIAVQLEPEGRGGSRELFETLEVGDRVELRGPTNNFALHRDASDYILLAGGIGITPLVAMADVLCDIGKNFRLFYFCRDKENAAFGKILEESRFASQVTLSYDNDPIEDRIDLQLVLKSAKPNTRIYTCGPAGFMDYVYQVAMDLGINPEKIHREYFAPQANIENSNELNRPFSIYINGNHGACVEVRSDESAIDALHRCGIMIPVSCEQGVCSTCLTKVIEGTPDHRDLFMSDEEHQRNDKFTPCVSRAVTEYLTIEVPEGLIVDLTRK